MSNIKYQISNIEYRTSDVSGEPKRICQLNARVTDCSGSPQRSEDYSGKPDGV